MPIYYEDETLEGFTELPQVGDALGKAASLLTYGAMAFGGGPIGILSFLLGQLPIWRVPGKPPEEGANLGDYIYQMMYCVEHIPIEQARREAYYLYESK